MRKILGMMVLSVTVLIISGIQIDAYSEQFDVSVNATFDTENSAVGTGLTDQTYGTKVQLSNQLPDVPSGDSYTFAFWIVNGVARYDLTLNHEFVITNDMVLNAVYSKSTEHAAIFIDANGQVVDIQYVLDGGNVTSPSGEAVTYTETFGNFVEPATYYDAGSFTGDHGNVWSYTESGDHFDLDTTALILDKDGDGSSLTVSLEGGIDTLSIDYYDAFSSPAILEIYINDVLVGTSPSVNDLDASTHATYMLEDIDVSGDFELKIVPGDGQTVVDNITWTTLGGINTSKPGFVLNETTPWSTSLNNVIDDTVYVLQYEIDTTDEYVVVVEGGSTSGMYSYNEEVTVTPDSLVDFSHWEMNGEIVSFNPNYTFTVLDNTTVTAVNTSPTVTEEPLIVLNGPMTLRPGYTSYVGQFYVPSDMTLLDYGLIASDANEPITLDTATTRHQGFAYNLDTNEFLMSLATTYNDIRAYLVVENASGTIEYYYSTYDDDTAPVLSGISATQSIAEGESYDHLAGVLAIDNVDGDITDDIEVTVTDSTDAPVLDYFDFSGLSSDIYTITYTVSDAVGNTSTDTTILSIGAVEVTASDLFISEYIEGSSNNKAIEIYNGTGSTVDLSQYSVNTYSNGSSTAGYSLTLSGTLADGDVYVIYNSSADQAIQSVGDESSSITYFNGDDAVALLKNTTVIDVIGEIGVDPGTEWPAGTDSTVEHTLVRAASVTGPNDEFTESEWVSYPQDTFDYIGSHTMDGSGGGSNPSDTTDPVISGVAASASISQGSSYDPWDGITASDDTDGNITANITLEVLDESMTEVTGYGDFSGLSAGLYHLNYSVSDAAGNTATETLNLSIVGTSGDNPSSPDAPTITMASNFEYLAEQNSSWTDQGCTANDPEDGSVSCTLDSGSVDTSTLGTYILSYSATDSDLNTTTVSVSVDVLEDLSLLSIDLDPYYDSAEGLYGEALLLALRTIINNGFNGVTYGDSRYMLDDTDQDPNNPSNLILVYYLTSIDGTWDSGATWNREHVWPQSLLGVDASNGTVNIASDLHNLKPADPGENSSRSNKYFDTVETSSSYAPPTESQGDIARILFYMIVMYDHLSLVNTEPSVYEMGKLDTLIEWYYSDPVDTFESNRNDVIYSYQDNRNPFIDYEHFLELIYWDNTTVTGAN